MYGNQGLMTQAAPRGLTDDIVTSVSKLSQDGVPITVGFDSTAGYLTIALFVAGVLLIITYLGLKKVI